VFLVQLYIHFVRFHGSSPLSLPSRTCGTQTSSRVFFFLP
jgi:hypothetical protein